MRAQDDAALDLVTEARPAGGRHDGLGGDRSRRRFDPQAVTHPVVAGQVGGGLGGHDEVVGVQRVLQVRQGDGLHLRAGRLEQLQGGVEGGHDAVVVALSAVKLGDDADSQSGQVPSLLGGPDHGSHVARGVRQRGRVQRVVRGDDVVQQGGVQHRTGHGAGRVEGGGHGDDAEARDRAVGRLDADRAGDGRGLADRAPGIGAHGHGGLVGAHGRGRATRGSSRDAAQVPGVGGASEGRVLGGAAHGELVEIGLAQDRGAGGAQVAHEGGVIGRHPSLEDP